MSDARTLPARVSATDLQDGVTGGMTMLVVDRLELVDVEIKKRRRIAVTLDESQRTLQFALEPAAAEDIEQRVEVGRRLERHDLGPRRRQLRLEPFDLGGQRRDGRPARPRRA